MQGRAAQSRSYILAPRRHAPHKNGQGEPCPTKASTGKVCCAKRGRTGCAGVCEADRRTPKRRTADPCLRQASLTLFAEERTGSE